MNLIWKINPSYIEKYNDLYFCKYCVKYTDDNFKKLLICETKPLMKNLKNEYCKCYFCNRIIKGIIYGPNIIKYLEIKKLNSSTLLELSRVSVWYYHDVYDEFGIKLRNKFNFSKEEIKNIYQCIKVLYGIPQIDYIRKKADDLIKYSSMDANH